MVPKSAVLMSTAGRNAVPLRAALRAVTGASTRRHASRSAHTMASSAAGPDGNPSTSGSAEGWRIKMLYDGDCPLCMREVDMLKRRDAGVGHIAFVDIATPSFDPSQHADISFKQAMERIHAVLPDGTVVKDVEVFRRLYEQVGLGWVYSLTRIPAVEKAANAVYDVWAKYRLPLTGREELEVVLAQKEACAGSDEACEVPAAANAAPAGKS